MKGNNKIFSLGIILLTSPLLLGARLVSEKERIILVILSLLLVIFYLFRLKKLIDFVLFLSVFISIFLSAQFIFFKRIDPFFLQLAILIFLLIKNKDWGLDDFSMGLIFLVIVIFLLQFFVNQILLGFYLNFWIDLKRNFPVFLFCLTYFILRKGLSLDKTLPWVSYFVGLFVLTTFFPYFGPGKAKGVAIRKAEYNLAFFYRDVEDWKEKSSSFRRGLVYEYLGLWSMARNEFKNILVTSPQNIDAHFNLARSYEAERLWYEAMLEYKKVIELNPDYHGSHYGLARAYEAMREIEKAEEEFLKEIEINPKEIKAYLALEALYKRQGHVKRIDKIRPLRLEKITASIEEKDISDANLRILPVVLDEGTLAIEIVARGTYAQGFWPRMEVWLSKEGRLERGGEAWVKSDTWKSYYFHFKTSPGEENLIIHFINDFFAGHDNDRNLYIKRVNFIYGK